MQLVHDVKWEEVIPYNIQHQHQPHQNCLVCGVRIPKKILCVKVDSIYKFKTGGSSVVYASFCLKKECLSGINKHRQSSRVHTYPEFKNTLVIFDEPDPTWKTVSMTLKDNEEDAKYIIFHF